MADPDVKIGDAVLELDTGDVFFLTHVKTPMKGFKWRKKSGWSKREYYVYGKWERMCRARRQPEGD